MTFATHPQTSQPESIALPDMDQWLKQHDLLYERAPEIWDEGMLLANGDIGAVLWFEAERLNISLDKLDLFETAPQTKVIHPDYHWSTLVAGLETGQWQDTEGVFSKSWQLVYHPPVGRIEINLGAPPTDFRGRLQLSRAQAIAQMVSAKQNLNLSAFIPPQKNVIVITIETDAHTFSPSVACHPAEVELGQFRFSGMPGDVRAAGPEQPVAYPPAELDLGGREWGWKQAMLNGQEFYVSGITGRPAPNRCVFYITLASSAEAPNPDLRARAVLREAKQEGVASLLEAHTAWWRAFWSRSFISIPDSQLESLYYLGICQLGSASNPEKHWPMGLLAPWTPDTDMVVGAGRPHFDLPMYYWPTFTSNRLEMLDALCEWSLKLLPEFCRRGREFGWEGPWLGGALGADGTISLMGDASTTYWPGCGAWVCHFFWLRYRYSLDEKFLRERAYPMMREFMKTYLGMLERGGDGLWHLPWSCSPEFIPENGIPWGPDASADLALIRFLTESLLESVGILKIDDPDAERWRDVQSNLAPFPQGTDGLHIWSGQPLDRPHRHMTHLFPMYPMHQISIDGETEDNNLINQSLAQVESHGFVVDWQCWSYVYLAMIYARVGKGDKCVEALKAYENYVTPVGLATNAPYVRGKAAEGVPLEPSLGMPAVIMEMLIQSWGGTIRVFPALPKAWEDAAFYRLRTEDAFLVSSCLKAGQVKFVSVESTVGGMCRIVDPYATPAKLYDSSGELVQSFTNPIAEFPTAPGAVYFLLPAGTDFNTVDFDLYQPARPPSEQNTYGAR